MGRKGWVNCFSLPRVWSSYRAPQWLLLCLCRFKRFPIPGDPQAGGISMTRGHLGLLLPHPALLSPTLSIQWCPWGTAWAVTHICFLNCQSEKESLAPANIACVDSLPWISCGCKEFSFCWVMPVKCSKRGMIPMDRSLWYSRAVYAAVRKESLTWHNSWCSASC